jgi:hypothetical protein
VPVSAEVLKKRKADAAAKVLGKRSKVATKISGLCAGASSKRLPGGNVLPVKSVKLSKCVIPHVIASAAAARAMPITHVLDVSVDVGRAKGGEKCQSSKLVPRTKVAPSAKKCIAPVIRALAVLSSDGSAESSMNDQAPEVQSRADPWGLLMEPHARSAAASGPQPTPEASLRVVPSTSAAGASTGCFWILEMLILIYNWSF